MEEPRDKKSGYPPGLFARNCPGRMDALFSGITREVMGCTRGICRHLISGAGEISADKPWIIPCQLNGNPGARLLVLDFEHDIEVVWL
jgi:hypothetical protein